MCIDKNHFQQIFKTLNEYNEDLKCTYDDEEKPKGQSYRRHTKKTIIK